MDGTPHGANRAGSPTFAPGGDGPADPGLAAAILNTVGALVVVLDREARIVLFNPACERTTGHAADEVMGRPVWDLLPPEEVEGVRGVVAALVSGRFPSRHENHWLTRDGQKRLIAWTNTCTTDARGRVEYVVATGLDVTEHRGAEEALHAERDRLETITRNIGAGLTIISREHRVLYANEVMVALFGDTTGRACYEAYNGRTAICPGCGVREVFEEGSELAVHEQLGRGANGEALWSQMFTTPIRNERGEVTSALELVIPITAHKEAEEALRESEERLRRIFEESPLGVVTAGLDYRFTRANMVFCEMTGYTEEELASLTFLDVTHPEHRTSDAAAVEALLRGAVPRYQTEKRYLRKNGETVWAAATVALLRDANGSPVHFITMVEDITERRRAEELIRHQAYFDALTDLPNRVHFAESSQAALARAQRRGRKLALLLCDLDRLKIVNDGFGHTTGDQLLKQLADRLRRQVRAGEVVARLGGDEFAFLLPETDTAEEATAAVRRFMRVLEEPFFVNGHELHVSASIGISVYPEDGEDTETLLKSADAALYHAKDAGRRTYRFHSPAMDAPILERIGVEARLRKAVRAGRLLVHYQPVFDLLSGEALIMEALVRWEEPGLGTVMPKGFIAVAEETGLIDEIGRFMLPTACAQARAWARIPGLAPPAVAVNLSARQFHDEGLVDAVSEFLLAADLEGRSLVLEITETAIMGNVHFSLSVMQRLKALGVRLALDDFGTGRSSLAYLKQFPIDLLKIDGSFIASVTDDPKDQAMVATIISMAHSLGMAAVAEGVETEAQLAFLREHRCDGAQGFLLARPGPAEQATERLQRAADRARAGSPL